LTKIEKEVRKRERDAINAVNKTSDDLKDIYNDALTVLWDVVLVLVGIVLGMYLSAMRAQAAETVSIPPRAEYVGPITEAAPEALPEVVNEVPAATMPDAVMVERVGEPHERWESLGVFRCTAYCGCRKCNGKWYGMPSASGAPLQAGVTVAVDKRLIPFFSTLNIDGVGVRVAHDTGRNIKGNSIDVYIPNHAIASAFGIQYHEVWILRKGE